MIFYSGVSSALLLPLVLPAETPATAPGPPEPSSFVEAGWLEGARFTSPLATPSPSPGFELEEFVDEDAWYVRGGGGFVSTTSTGGPGEEIDFDEGYMVGLAFGRHFGAQKNRFAFDVELEGLWNDQDTEGDLAGVRDYTAATLLLNAIVEFRLVDRLFLYGGGGIGTSFVDVGTTSDTISDFEADDGPYLAWQLKGGLLWRFNRSLGANLGYRFVNINDIEIQDSISTDNFELGTEQHVLEIGVTFSF